MKKIIHKNYKKMLYAEIAKIIGTTESKVCNYINRTGLRLTEKEYERRKSIGKFKLGQIAWNAGLSLPNKPNSGQFQKGSKPPNTKPDGHVTLRHHKRTGEKYLFIKISDRNWKLLHRHNWEIVNGTVQKKYVLRFKDGDTLNCNIENLELISMKENLKRNSLIKRNDPVIHSDRYVAARMKIYGKKNQEQFIKEHPEIIEIKRQQLLLQRGINENRR
jgi:hypothetical protein